MSRNHHSNGATASPAGNDDSGSDNHDGDDESMMSPQNKSKKEQEEEEEIAAQESRWVWILRIATFGFLFLTTIGVALFVFFSVRASEENLLEEKFRDNASKVLEAIGTLLKNTLAAVDSFTVTTTSYAASVHSMQDGAPETSPWPFVTIPDFAVRGSKMRSLSKVFLFSLYHHVKHADRDAWENYTRTHDGWVDEAIETQETDPTYDGVIVDDWTTIGQINWWGQRAEDAEFYMPRWQAAPVVPRWDPYNWNAYQHPLLQGAMKRVLDHRTVVVAESYNLGPESGVEQVDLSDYLSDDEKGQEPAVEMYAPVIDDTSGTVSLINNTESPVVAIIAISMQWYQLIQDLLPEGSGGMVAVISNGCNQSFTYEISGPEAIYRGFGDLHKNEYDSLKEFSSLADLAEFSTKQQTYTGAPLDREYCPYSITLYPSQELADEYLTSTPWVLSASAVAIFLFTSCIFFAFDWAMERRQTKVMTTAKRSTAIVDSLFPANVKERLYQQRETEEHNKAAEMAPQGHMMKAFLRGSENEVSQNSGMAIADLFESTTVMFADLKGFTAWSSSRSPSQVFQLLETLYSAFDEIADMRGVYKIETIGDSYVAVCGLPEPRSDHAVVMTKFAAQVRSKTTQLAKELEEKLGEGTGNLQMRIGLHSGATTAGVLRGQRARFQLFGDTVNTAARMESNGEGNRIHVSQATAELLMEAGKNHWLTKRADIIEAKGKGTMQTYWVEPYHVAYSTTSHAHGSDTLTAMPPLSPPSMDGLAESRSPSGSLTMLYPPALRNSETDDEEV